MRRVKRIAHLVRLPTGEIPKPVTAREIVTIADCKTYWYACTFLVEEGPIGPQVRRLLERERDWYALNGVQLEGASS